LGKKSHAPKAELLVAGFKIIGLHQIGFILAAGLAVCFHFSIRFWAMKIRDRETLAALLLRAPQASL
jgi:hypothetical protein